MPPLPRRETLTEEHTPSEKAGNSKAASRRPSTTRRRSSAARSRGISPACSWAGRVSRRSAPSATTRREAGTTPSTCASEDAAPRSPRRHVRRDELVRVRVPRANGPQGRNPMPVGVVDLPRRLQAARGVHGPGAAGRRPWIYRRWLTFPENPMSRGSGVSAVRSTSGPPIYLNAGKTSRANRSIDRITRACSRSPNQKLQLKCVMPTISSTRLI
jgi:hypothetical protein